GGVEKRAFVSLHPLSGATVEVTAAQNPYYPNVIEGLPVLVNRANYERRIRSLSIGMHKLVEGRRPWSCGCRGRDGPWPRTGHLRLRTRVPFFVSTCWVRCARPLFLVKMSFPRVRRRARYLGCYASPVVSQFLESDWRHFSGTACQRARHGQICGRP